MGRLDGKVAVVTGGAMGIGKAAALTLAREGAKVAVADIDGLRGAATLAEIERAGGEGLFQLTDVGVSAAVRQLIQATIERWDRLDILVNNVGVAIAGSVTELDEESWNRVINLNLTSIWRGMHYAIPEMIQRSGGSIINTSSVQSLIGFPGWAGYAATKGGINALTQQAAVDYARYNIRINAIAPGTIMTPMNERLLEMSEDPEQLMATWKRLHALDRVGKPEEVAGAILFLASDDSSFVTGEVLRVDGGMVVKAF